LIRFKGDGGGGRKVAKISHQNKMGEARRDCLQYSTERNNIVGIIANALIHAVRTLFLEKQNPKISSTTTNKLKFGIQEEERRRRK